MATRKAPHDPSNPPLVPIAGGVLPEEKREVQQLATALGCSPSQLVREGCQLVVAKHRPRPREEVDAKA